MATRSPRSRSQWLAPAAAAALAGVAGLFVALAGSAARAAPPSAPPPLECVAVQTEASFATVGYDHLVHLTNNCKKATTCSVKTNVNPEAASVQLAPGESQTVVTWRGSPAREFTADVSCRER
jgi:hypothetical protein